MTRAMTSHELVWLRYFPGLIGRHPGSILCGQGPRIWSCHLEFASQLLSCPQQSLWQDLWLLLPRSQPTRWMKAKQSSVEWVVHITDRGLGMNLAMDPSAHRAWSCCLQVPISLSLGGCLWWCQSAPNSRCGSPDLTPLSLSQQLAKGLLPYRSFSPCSSGCP